MFTTNKIIGKLFNQLVATRNDVHAMQERTKTMEAQLGKIAESQTLTLARFAGKPESNPVEDLKMMRVENKDEKPKDLDYRNALSLDCTVEDPLKRITVKKPSIEEGNDVMYQQFIK